MTKEEIIKKAKIMWNDFHTPKEVMEFVFDEAEKEFNKKIEELERYYIRKKWIRPNTWELFYPDGTSRLMNFNPLEEQRKKFKKKIEELKMSATFLLGHFNAKNLSAEDIRLHRQKINKILEELNNEGKDE